MTIVLAPFESPGNKIADTHALAQIPIGRRHR
jgi:hypothetical protein